VSTLTVTNSSFENNGTGVQVQPSGSGTLWAAFDATQITGNRSNGGLLMNGTEMTGGIDVAVTNSAISNNPGGGVSVASTSGPTNLFLTHVQVANNGVIGVESSGTAATVWLGQTTITGNPVLGYGAESGSTINSFDDNYIADNGSNSGTLGTASKQ